MERVKQGIYSLSKLARWVDEGSLVVAAKGWHTNPAEVDYSIAVHKLRDMSDSFDCWEAAQIEEPLTELGAEKQSTRPSIALVFGPSDTDLESTHQPPVNVVEHQCPSHAPSESFNVSREEPNLRCNIQGSGDIGEAMCVDQVEPGVADVQQSPEALLDGMRGHYLQALYVSNVRLPFIFLDFLWLTFSRHLWHTSRRDL